MAVVQEKQTPSRRLIELDILRGFLLLWMTLTHLPTKASVISNQTFGFVSGAEGFIFLAGFMVGQLEHRIERKRGYAATLRDLVRRTVRVYVYHAGLLLIAFTVIAPAAVHFGRLSIQNLLSFYLASPGKAIAAAGILEYRPSLFDILPLYVIFLALTPLARKIARRRSWSWVVYPSFAIWAVAQFGLRAWLYRRVNLFGLGVPENSTGAFDMYAWQLLWMVGLALGTIYADTIADEMTQVGAAAGLRINAGLLRLSAIVAAIFLVLRYSPLDRWMHPLHPDIYGWLIDKWHLGLARVINFSAVTILLVRFGQRIASLLILRPLASLGQASIEVFSVHVLCCVAGSALSREADPRLPWWQQIVLIAVTLFALFFTAHVQRKRASG